MGSVARCVFSIAVAGLLATTSVIAQQPVIADSTLEFGAAHVTYRLSGAGPAVILVHGFAGGANDLATLRGALAATHTTISVEIRGFGQTSGPLSASGADTSIVEDIARVMDHLHIRRADFVGFSMGAVLTMRLATLHPGLVRSLVLVSAAPMLRPAAHALWDPIAADLEQGRGIATLIRATIPVGAAVPADSLMAATSRQVIGAHDSRAWASVARGMPSLSFEAADLQQVRVPVLVVYGANDPLMRGHAEWAAMLPAVRVDTVPNADHASARQAPAFLRLAQAFLESPRAP
jgi:pimeloyl-ACP methyl ester carboxylesterase